MSSGSRTPSPGTTPFAPHRLVLTPTTPRRTRRPTLARADTQPPVLRDQRDRGTDPPEGIRPPLERLRPDEVQHHSWILRDQHHPGAMYIREYTDQFFEGRRCVLCVVYSDEMRGPPLGGMGVVIRQGRWAFLGSGIGRVGDWLAGPPMTHGLVAPNHDGTWIEEVHDNEVLHKRW